MANGDTKESEQDTAEDATIAALKKELKAMEKIAIIMDGLDEPQNDRVVSWLFRRVEDLKAKRLAASTPDDE